ncbi:MAG TPA: outer membrane beta-barrel protein [Flavipsychrobacter sp.]|nr:outer membrane beta-barrel protein [Flavipsychrobacter sp.]
MRKIIAALFVMIATSGSLLPYNSIAQETEQAKSTNVKWIFGITGGLSVPFGNYVKADYDNSKSGFAKAGSDFGVTATYFLNKNFGISALISYHKYAFNGVQNMANGLKESFDVDSVYLETNGDNHVLNILVGPYYSIPAGKRLSVDFRVLIGLANASLAGNNVILTDGGVTDPEFYQKPATATTFALQAGAGLRYNISNSFGIMLNADYFYSKPNFKIDNVDRLNNAGRKIDNYNEPIACINTNITLVYLLRHK